MRSPSRPAALVAGRHTRARNPLTRNGPPWGAVNTSSSRAAGRPEMPGQLARSPRQTDTTPAGPRLGRPDEQPAPTSLADSTTRTAPRSMSTRLPHSPTSSPRAARCSRRTGPAPVPREDRLSQPLNLSRRQELHLPRLDWHPDPPAWRLGQHPGIHGPPITCRQLVGLLHGRGATALCAQPRHPATYGPLSIEATALPAKRGTMYRREVVLSRAASMLSGSPSSQPALRQPLPEAHPAMLRVDPLPPRHFRLAQEPLGIGLPGESLDRCRPAGSR